MKRIIIPVRLVVNSTSDVAKDGSCYWWDTVDNNR